MADFDFEVAFAAVKDYLTQAQQNALREAKDTITDAAMFNDVRKTIVETIVEQNDTTQEPNSSEIIEEENQKPSDEHSSTDASRPAGEGNGQDATAPVGETKSTEDVIETQQEVSVKSEQDIEREKLAQDFKKVYGDNSFEGHQDEALRVLNEKGLNSNGEPASIHTLAKTRLAIKEAEFKQKYGIDPHTGEPLKDKEGKPLEAKDGKFLLDERSEALLANKDNANDAILRRMEGLSSGKDKDSIVLGDNALNKDGKEKQTETGSFVKTNYSFEVLYDNAPEELTTHCHKTLDKARRNALLKPQAKQMKKDAKMLEVLNKRMDRLANRTQKMSQYNIKEDDGLVTRFFKNTKRSVREWKYQETDRFNDDVKSLKEGVKETLWTKNPLVKMGKKVWDNKYRRGFRNWRAKQANRARLLPSRATKWLKGKAEIAKGWLKNKAKSGWNWLKNKSWAGKAVTGIGKAVSWTAGKAVSGVKAVGRSINKYAIQPLIVKPAKFVWRNKGKIALGAAVLGVTYATGGLGGMALYGGGVLAAGYGIKKALPDIKSAAKGAKQYASEQVTLTKEAVKTKVENMNVSMLETAVEKQGGRNTEMEGINAELARIKGEAIYNNNPREISSVFSKYQNNGKPKDDKESAVQLMQMLTSKDKTKGGLGLEPEQVNDLVAYLNQSQLKDGQKSLPTYEEMQKASTDTKEQPTQETENKSKTDSGAEQEVKKKPNPMNSLVDNQAEQLNFAIKAYHANIASGRVTEEQAAQNLGSILSKPKDKGGLGLSPEQAQEMKNYLGYRGAVKSWEPKKNTENNPVYEASEMSIDRFARKKVLNAQTLKAQKAKTGNEI